MTTRLVEFLSRCDFESLTNLVGDTTVTLLKKVVTESLNPESLAFLIVSVLGEEGALRNKTVRQLLFSKLDTEEGKKLCELLQLPTSTALTTLNSTNFDINPFNFELLTRWFAVPYSASELTNREIEVSRKTVASHKLRSHQLNAFRKLRTAIANPNASALVHMPWGAGKLRLVATAVVDLYRSERDGQVVLWLTPGEALCDDAFNELRAVWEHLGSRDITIYRLYGNRDTPDLGSLENCIIVADIAKIKSEDADLDKLGKKARVVIFGDAEHISKPAGANILTNLSKESDLSLIAISASSGSEITSSSDSGELHQRFCDSYITIDCAEPIRLLGESNDLCNIKIEVKDIDCDAGTITKSENLEYDAREVERISKDVNRNQALLELIISESETTQGNVVFYATTGDQARLFAGLLAFRGIQAMSVTSDKSPEERDREMQKFHARNGKILCVHGFFISGSSVPNIAKAIIALPTLSHSVFYGMIGRLGSARLTEGHLKIVAVADSIPPRANAHRTFETWTKLDFSEL